MRLDGDDLPDFCRNLSHVRLPTAVMGRCGKFAAPAGILATGDQRPGKVLIVSPD
jgi:hypothetical protein